MISATIAAISTERVNPLYVQLQHNFYFVTSVLCYCTTDRGVYYSTDSLLQSCQERQDLCGAALLFAMNNKLVLVGVLTLIKVQKKD